MRSENSNQSEIDYAGLNEYKTREMDLISQDPSLKGYQKDAEQNLLDEEMDIKFSKNTPENTLKRLLELDKKGLRRRYHTGIITMREYADGMEDLRKYGKEILVLKSHAKYGGITKMLPDMLKDRNAKASFKGILAALGILSAVAAGALVLNKPSETRNSLPTAAQPTLLPTEKSTVISPSTTESPKLTTTLIQETDPSFKISDKCEIQKNSGASGGSWLACPTEGKPPAPGAKISVDFTGTSVSVLHITAPFGGIAKVQIDGKDYHEIDTYSKDIAVQVRTEIASGLPNTNHTLTFEIANKKNPLSGQPNEAGLISIDAIEVMRPSQ